MSDVYASHDLVPRRDRTDDWRVVIPFQTGQVTSSVLLTRVAHQESKLLIWLRLSARLVNRDKDLIATTDAHRRPVRVHAQRPGTGLQAKQSESLRAQDSAIQKPDQNRNNICLTVYTITPMY